MTARSASLTDGDGELGFFTGLIEYYGKSIAGLMVWLDTDQNDYRRHVLPLAKSEPGLRLAVAAIAAHHGSNLFPHNPPNFPELARDACLGFVKQGAKEMTNRLTTGSGLASSTDMVGGEWMLASVLIMICFEMVQSRLEVAECHKQAARTIVNVFGPTAAGRSHLFRFLQNQLAIHDVLASTTSFNLADVQNTITPPANSETALFADYLTSLHRVTLASRQVAHHSSETVDSMRSQRMSASFVHNLFEQARGSTLMAAGRLHVNNSKNRRDLIHLVEVYHKAALLYSYRCMGLETLGAVTYAEHHLLALQLPDELLQFSDQQLCIQNLPWPALVAGTECHGDRERQAKVVKIFLDIYEATKFKHYLEILEFLETFWDGPWTDWRPLAQEWEMAGRRIIPV